MRTRYSISVVLVVIAAAGIAYAALRAPFASGSAPVSTPAEDRALEEVRAAVTAFGQRLKNVSVLAPSSELSTALEESYSAYVSPELLAAWKADPGQALGRKTSNPSPEEIDVDFITMASDGSYTVEGSVIETTSTGEQASASPIALRVERRGGSWLITKVQEGAISTPQRISVEGSRICLPHRDTTGPQTLECALGIQGDDGENYALDLNLLSSTDAADTANTAERMRVEGVFTPGETLSSDRWLKYDMAGILSATSVVEIE